MAEKVTRVCDMCGAENPDTYTVSEKGRGEWVIDLCDKCSEPIPLWRARSRPPKGKRPAYNRFKITKLPEQPRDRR